MADEKKGGNPQANEERQSIGNQQGTSQTGGQNNGGNQRNAEDTEWDGDLRDHSRQENENK